MRAGFESRFKTLLADIRTGQIRTERIDLHGVNLSAKHLNALASALEDNFRVASSITEIDLSFTGANELPKSMFKDCDGLRKLNLGNNKLNKLPDLPDRPYALQYFNAGYNPLEKVPAAFFSNCISLKIVYLNETQIETPPGFPDSLSLSLLHLNSNPIKKFPAKYFKYMQSLDTIFINDTMLKELPDLSPCDQLQEVWVDEVKVPQKHVAETAHIFKCSPRP